MIAIVDYGLGNISAFGNILKRLNIKYVVADNVNKLRQATKIILPGVGAFDYAMASLEASGLRETLDIMVLDEKIPVIGVCVGMQIMASTSEEGAVPGLNWIPGHVRKIDASSLHHKPTIPHMGWNQAMSVSESSLFNGVDHDLGFYFLHSYYYQCDKSSHVLATAHYGQSFTCAIHRGNIFGVQFHPEKSLNNGIRLLKNFSEL